MKKSLSSRYTKRLNDPARQLPFLQTLAAPYNLAVRHLSEEWLSLTCTVRLERFPQRVADLGLLLSLTGDAPHISFPAVNKWPARQYSQLFCLPVLCGLCRGTGEQANCANSAHSLVIYSTKVLRQSDTPGSLQWQDCLASWSCKP